jgi:hypothetical protein
MVHPGQIGKGANREQQIWTYRYEKANPPAILPPTNVRVRTEKGVAIVEWDAVPGTTYVLAQGIGETPWTATFGTTAQVGTERGSFRKKFETVKGVPFFRVGARGKDGKEIAFSPIVRAQPRVPEDVVASVVGAREVWLEWKPVADAVGYHVERAPVEVFTEDQLVRLKKDTDPLAEPSVGAIRSTGAFERITLEPVTATTLKDTGIDLGKLTKVEGEPAFAHRFAKEQIDETGKPYRFGVHAYRVRAVNALGVVGGPSAWQLTIPSGVQNVFAREDGKNCHLNWTANREKDIKGYRVYRMDGPKINGAGQKVLRRTADPVRELKWTDEPSATDTKRYWIVAVDALGQEGIPSAPAWAWRQYKKVYDGFTGEWHQ